MERPTTRKSAIISDAKTRSTDDDLSNKKRRRRVTSFPPKLVILKLFRNPWLPRTVLILANFIFIVAIVKSSSSDSSLRITSASALDFPFPPLRAPAKIHHVDGKDLMSHVGYLVKPQVVGAYFANYTSSSFQGVQVLPTQLERRLTHHVVTLPKEQIEQQLHLTDSDDYEDRMRDDFGHTSCKAPYEWMEMSFPTCNFLHEADLTDLQGETNRHKRVSLLGSGYWRDVWKLQNDLNERVVAKTLRYEHEWADRNYDRHRRDALAAERLTWSPNVIDIYSYCGNSGIYEFAPGGDIEEVLWYSDMTWNSTERLVVAFQVATGIADAHNSERNGIPAIAHADITTSQFVNVNGVYKLNDFNRCRFIAVHDGNQHPCLFLVGNNPGTFRAPEEYAYKLESEKVDIYSMGNVFYALLTDLWPFEKEVTKKAQGDVKRGIRPPIQLALKESKDPAHKALLAAMQMCWKQDPAQRATAKEVKDYLEVELKKLGFEDP